MAESYSLCKVYLAESLELGWLIMNSKWKVRCGTTMLFGELLVEIWRPGLHLDFELHTCLNILSNLAATFVAKTVVRI